MKLNNRELYELFEEKGVKKLFHANTVATSITFLEEGGLVSRDWIARNEQYQTPQSSDDIDKLFDVFDDVFLDTADLHKHFSRQNHYGPVLFQFGLELLLDESLELWVTKDNPIYWAKNAEPSDYYFKNVSELASKWDTYDKQRKMLTIRKPNEPILFNYLEEIVLDNPKVLIHDDVSLGKESRKALIRAVSDNEELKSKLVWRECGHCFCRDNYLKQVPTSVLAQKFLPLEHAKFEE